MKKIISLLLLLSCLASLAVACTPSSQDGGSTTESTSFAESSLESDINLPNLSWDGKTFTLCVNHPDHVSRFGQEQETTDVVESAVYRMLMNAEKQYELDIQVIAAGFDDSGEGQRQYRDFINAAIEGGETKHDVYVHVQHQGMPELIRKGLFLDWKECEYIDFTHEAWLPSYTDSLNYGEKIYLAASAWNINAYTQMSALLFNKTLMDELMIEYPYDDVREKNWTIEKFLTLVQAGTKDLNHDDFIEEYLDRCGYVGWGYEMVDNVWTGMGGTSIKKENGFPVLTIDSERNFDVIEAMCSLRKLDGNIEVYSGNGAVDTFAAGKALFLDIFVNHIAKKQIRDMADNYGVIPYPLLDENQPNYYARQSLVSGVFYLPKTNNDLAFTGFVMQLLSEEAYKNIKPLYLETYLTIRGTRDDDSIEMVDLILKNQVVTDAITGIAISSMSQGGQNSFSSQIAKNLSVWQGNLQSTIDFYKDLENPEAPEQGE